MSYTYILKLSNGSYYVGSCRDLHKRLGQHMSGYVKSTQNRRPLVVVYSREYSTYSEASIEEKRIKKWKKRRSIENLILYDKNNLILAPSYSPV